jgi:2-dehydro-3-deoxyphosphogluconate aldolase/(4S)-4-hydroxy-2-oxoglutarate aldolase
LTDAIGEILEKAPVVPILTLVGEATRTLDDVLPLADALVEGGLRVIEVTLRTPVGLPAIERLRERRPELVIGAGTIWNASDYALACERGAQFLVSPGTTDALFAHAANSSVPWLPGGQTVTELARIQHAGFGWAKFFPAEAVGGVATAAAIGDVLPALRLCVTGGINQGNAAGYLGLPNVACVAGSWVAPARLITARDWPGIAALARTAAECAVGDA